MEETLEKLNALKLSQKKVFEKVKSVNAFIKLAKIQIESLYDYNLGGLTKPKVYQYLKLADGTQAICLSVEGNFQEGDSIYTRFYENKPAHLFPLWSVKGKNLTNMELLLDSRTPLGADTKKISEITPLSTDVVGAFFSYLEKATLSSQTSVTSSLESVDSFNHPEEIGVVSKCTTDSTGSLGLEEVILMRKKRIKYSRANVSSVIVSTPHKDRKHREPNPSDRRSYVPERPVPMPTYEIKYTAGTESFRAKKRESVKAGRTFPKYIRSPKINRALSGRDIFSAVNL